jgi:hypothetical protein
MLITYSHAHHASQLEDAPAPAPMLALPATLDMTDEPALISQQSATAAATTAAAAGGGGKEDMMDACTFLATYDNATLLPPEGVVDMMIRPTNVLDPEIVIHPREGQLATLLQACAAALAHGDRVLVMALRQVFYVMCRCMMCRCMMYRYMMYSFAGGLLLSSLV